MRAARSRPRAGTAARRRPPPAGSPPSRRSGPRRAPEHRPSPDRRCCATAPPWAATLASPASLPKDKFLYTERSVVPALGFPTRLRRALKALPSLLARSSLVSQAAPRAFGSRGSLLSPSSGPPFGSREGLRAFLTRLDPRPLGRGTAAHPPASHPGQ